MHEQLEEQIVQGIGRRIELLADPVELLEVGLRAFRDVCTDRRSPGSRCWMPPRCSAGHPGGEIGERYGLGLIVFTLSHTMDAGALRRQEVRPLAHVLIGALDEAALYIADADDPALARDQIEPALMSLLAGLRSQP